MHTKLVVILILAGFAVVFIIQNVTVVQIQFLFWSIQMSRSIFMFLMLFIGVAIGWFLHGYWNHRKAGMH